MNRRSVLAAAAVFGAAFPVRAHDLPPGVGYSEIEISRIYYALFAAALAYAIYRIIRRR